jgi:transposase
MSANNIYLIISDQIEQLLGEVELARLDPSATQSAATIAVLALVTVFQFVENLPDRRAAEATRTRLDWKYALHLPWAYPGLEYSVLGEFRRSLVRDPAALQAFQQLLERLIATGLLSNAGERSLEAGSVLEVVDRVSRLERLLQAMRMALETLAAVEPDQLRTITLPHWYERYGRMQATRPLPRSLEEQTALAQAIGADATYLLEAIARTADHLASLPELQALQQVWL